MRIKKFQAKNVRSFKEELNIELSGFNVFIGENSSGKSNLISLIRTATQSANGTGVNVPSFDGMFPESSNFSCLMEFDRKDIEQMTSTEAFNRILSESRTSQFQGTREFGAYRSDIESFSKTQKLELSSSWSREGNMIIRQSLPALSNLVVPDQPILNDVFTQYRTDFLRRIYALVYQQMIRNSIFVSDTRDLLVNFPLGGWNQNSPIDANSIPTFITGWMLNDRPTYDSFISLVKRLLPRLENLQVEPSGNMANLFVRENDLTNQFSGNELSKGSREILVVLGAIALAKESSVLFIEEPEIHLHPFALRELKSIMLDAVKEKDLQIVISTHYPLFLQDLDPETDQTVKVFKFENKEKSGNYVREIRTDKEISELIDKLILNIGQ